MMSFNKLLRAIKKEGDEEFRSLGQNFFSNERTLPQIWKLFKNPFSKANIHFSDLEDKQPVHFRMEGYCRHQGMIISQRKELPLVITFTKLNPLIASPNNPPCSITFPTVNKIIDLRGQPTGVPPYGYLPNFTFYIAFNRYPTPEVYDLMYDTPEFIKLPKRMSVFISKRDSIRFLISTKEKIDMKILADFKGIFKPPIIDCSIKYFTYSDYAKALKKNVIIPKRVLMRIEKERKNQDNAAHIICKNKKRARELSFEARTDRIRELSEIREDRMVKAKSKRRLLLRDKRNKTMKGLNRFIRVKIQNQKTVNYLINKFLGDTLKKVWVSSIIRMKILLEIKNKLYVSLTFNL